MSLYNAAVLIPSTAGSNPASATMKNFKVVYLDENNVKKSEEVSCYSIYSAKTTFVVKNKDKNFKILYVFSLGKSNVT